VTAATSEYGGGSVEHRCASAAAARGDVVSKAAFGRSVADCPIRPMSRSQSALRLMRRFGLAVFAAAAVVAAVVVVAAVASGALDSADHTLVLMGFDADRARLITALVVGGVAAAGAAMATNRTAPATLVGCGGSAVLFGDTFAQQTHAALHANGVDGSFDLNGWLLTLLALAMSGVVASWAGATLALGIRPALVEAGRAVGDSVRSRRLDRGRLRLPLGVVVVVILLFVSVPVFGDIVNYTTDSRMLHGGPPAQGLARRPGPPDDGPRTQSPRPWLSYKPSGAGSVQTAYLPAPWKNTTSATETVDVYTPPGYDPAGHRLYPVLYEAEYPYDLWDTGVNIGVVLDTLIDQGTIPPMIVVFVSDVGAPFVDSECANSTNGVEWMDTFVSKTAVSYVDENYLTIAQANARATIGFSEGGYCAAILPLRHPTVFATSIPVSGYFWAGDGGSTSALPFAGSASALADASPMIVATHLPAAQRSKLYFIVVADPGQPLYGDEAAAFERLLKVEGYPVVAINSDLPHGWDQLRRELPAVLEAWAGHLVAAGVSGRA